VHVHQAKAYLAVMMAGPRLQRLTRYPAPPAEVAHSNQAQRCARPPAHGATHDRRGDRRLAFLYCAAARAGPLPGGARSHAARLDAAVFGVVGRASGRWSWEFFFLGAGFMLLETKSITQFALLWDRRGSWRP